MCGAGCYRQERPWRGAVAEEPAGTAGSGAAGQDRDRSAAAGRGLGPDRARAVRRVPEAARAGARPMPGRAALSWPLARFGAAVSSRVARSEAALARRAAPIAIAPPRTGLGQDRNRGRSHRRRGQGRGGWPGRSTWSTSPALPLALAASFPLAPATPARTRRTPALALRARLDHRQRHALPLLIDPHHPDRHHVSHAHHVMRALDVAIGKLADVHQARILETNVDECPKIHHVQDRPLQLHAGGQVFDLQDPLLEDRLGKIFARIALGAAQAFNDVTERELTSSQVARPARRNRPRPAGRGARGAAPGRAPHQPKNPTSPGAR